MSFPTSGTSCGDARAPSICLSVRQLFIRPLPPGGGVGDGEGGGGGGGGGVGGGDGGGRVPTASVWPSLCLVAALAHTNMHVHVCVYGIKGISVFNPPSSSDHQCRWESKRIQMSLVCRC